MAVIVGQGISVSPVADAELSHESTSTVQNKVVTDAIASEYSTSKTYNVGDVCTHDGKLYECIVDIPTAEGWTLSHWKVSNLGDNVSALNVFANDLFGAMHSGLFMETNTKKQITAYDHSTPNYSGFTGFIPNSSVKPYYACSFGAKYVEFQLNIPSGYEQLWIGCELSNGAFYGGNALHTSKQLRYILNNTASIIAYDNSKVVLQAGNTYAIKAMTIGNYFLLMANNKLVQRFAVPSNYNVIGVAMLNTTIVGDIFSDVYVETNNQLIYKGVSANITQDRSLSHIVDPIILSVNGTSWDDTPTGNSGLLCCLRYSNNTLQVYYEISGNHKMAYYRLVSTADFSIIVPWQSFTSNTVITPFKTVTDADVTNNGWTSFKNLPVNVIHCLNMSAQNMRNLGFPVTRASTFFSFSPYGGNTQAFKVYCIITNDSASELNMLYIAFGHGSAVTPWTSIDTYNGAGFKNPLAAAVFDSNSKIVFVGDSIVAGQGGTGYNISESGGGSYIMNHHSIERYENIAGHCWVNSLIDHIKTIYGITNVHNRGVGGINTKTILDNISTIFDGATMVVLSCGANDYTNNANIYTYLPQIVKYCMQNNIKVMVMTNTPNNTDDKNMFNAVQGQIQRTCNAIGIPCYDMYAEFEVYRKLKGLSLADVLSSDGVHPNDTGYDIMYDCALKLFGI